MNRIVDLILFVIVTAVLWLGLNSLLVAFGIVEPWSTAAQVAFVIVAVLSLFDYYRGGGKWFFNRGPV